MDKKQKLNMAVVSTVCLLAGFAVLQFLQWILVSTGSYLSAFHGHIEWNTFVIYATAGKWNIKQVVFLFLFPDLVFFIIYLVLSFRRKQIVNKPDVFHLFYSWIFLLIMVRILFLPFWQIIYRSGVYYALSWFRMSRVQQIALGLFLMAVFLLNVFSISSMFSSGLKVYEKQFLVPKLILPQLIFLWFVPLLIFSFLIYFISGTKIIFPNNYLIGGIVFALLINLPVISSYKVIVK